MSPGKSLLKALPDIREDYTVKRILTIVFQLVKALNHMQLNGVVWCNLSHENILYDGQNVTCVNFSEARYKGGINLNLNKSLVGLVGKINKNLNLSLGKIEYASPEMLKNQKYGFRHDVWSLGVLTYFLFAGKFPFQGANEMMTREKILNHDLDTDLLVNRKVSRGIIALIKKMLNKNSIERITCKKLLKKPVFDVIRANESCVGHLPPPAL